MKQSDPQLKLRLPPLLKRNVQDAAERMHRTLSSEIIARLEWSFDDASGFERYDRSKLAGKCNASKDQLGTAAEFQELKTRVTTLEKLIATPCQPSPGTNPSETRIEP